MNFQEEKSCLREAIAQRIVAMSEKDRAAESRSVCRRIAEYIPENLDAVCLYVPLKTEVNITPLFSEFSKRNIPIYLPRFSANALEFRKWDGKELAKGALNIPEPPASADLLSTKGHILVLVPGRAFDSHGGRLGRGNGGYDRWMRFYRAQNPEAELLGICFECQMVREIPMEEHDERVDAVVTARGKMM